MIPHPETACSGVAQLAIRSLVLRLENRARADLDSALETTKTLHKRLPKHYIIHIIRQIPLQDLLWSRSSVDLSLLLSSVLDTISTVLH